MLTLGHHNTVRISNPVLLGPKGAPLCQNARLFGSALLDPLLRHTSDRYLRIVPRGQRPPEQRAACLEGTLLRELFPLLAGLALRAGIRRFRGIHSKAKAEGILGDQRHPHRTALRGGSANSWIYNRHGQFHALATAVGFCDIGQHLWIDSSVHTFGIWPDIVSQGVLFEAGSSQSRHLLSQTGIGHKN